MTTFFQIIIIIPLIAYVFLIFLALRFVRKQNLSERELIIWDMIVIFCPIGALIPFLYFNTK